MIDELMKEYIKILESNKKQEGEYSVGEIAMKAGCSKETAKAKLEEWIADGLWTKREASFGKRPVTYYRPLKSPDV